MNRTASWRRVGLVAMLATFSAHAASAERVQTAEPVRVGSAIAAPQKIKDVRAAYPAEAQRARIQGVVVIEATIGTDGKVRDARVLRSIPMLDQAALDAVRQWEYTPTVVNGVAVPVVMTVTVNFSLQGSTAAPPPASMIRLAAIARPPGMLTVWEITPERAGLQPQWNPADAAPALSITAAAGAASSWLQQRNQDVAPFELQNVMLTRRRQGPGVSFWFYQLDFLPASGATSGPPIRVVVLPDGSIVEPRSEPIGPTAATPNQTPLPPGVYRPGGDVSAPRVLKQVQANYTDQARAARIQGTIWLEFVVQVDGSVESPRVVQSLDPGLDAESIKAIRQWRFEPGMKDGQPVPVLVRAEMTFTLR